jgi:glycerate dehydrogenase
MDIVLLDRQTFAGAIQFPLPRIEGCRWREYPTTLPSQLPERAADAEVIITNKVPVRAEALEQLPRLRLIAVAATGVDHIDLEPARARGVAVCNVSDYATESVAEHVFAMLLALRRQIMHYHQAVLNGDWPRSPIFTLNDREMVDLAGSTLGIIGAGTLGQAVTRLGEAFGMRVWPAERRDAEVIRAGYTPFDEVLRHSDVISLHVPLNANTRHLIGHAELALMKSTAVLINTARGGVVDEAALADALRAGRIGGACIDVLSREPPPPDHPLLSADLPNLLITPHIAWASRQAQQRLAREVVMNIEAYLRGEQRNRII